MSGKCGKQNAYDQDQRILSGKRIKNRIIFMVSNQGHKNKLFLLWKYKSVLVRLAKIS